jgi:hypothetical protein
MVTTDLLLEKTTPAWHTVRLDNVSKRLDVAFACDPPYGPGGWAGLAATARPSVRHSLTCISAIAGDGWNGCPFPQVQQWVRFKVRPYRG